MKAKRNICHSRIEESKTWNVLSDFVEHRLLIYVNRFRETLFNQTKHKSEWSEGYHTFISESLKSTYQIKIALETIHQILKGSDQNRLYLIDIFFDFLNQPQGAIDTLNNFALLHIEGLNKEERTSIQTLAHQIDLITLNLLVLFKNLNLI